MKVSERKLSKLRTFPELRRCSRGDLIVLGGFFDEVKLPPGRVLTEEDQRGYEVFLVIDGTADVYRRGAKVAVLGPGAVVGEIAVLDRGVRTATVIAATHIDALVATNVNFIASLSMPGMRRLVALQLAARLRDLDAREPVSARARG